MGRNQLAESSQELLKKHVSAIHISGALSLVERKLVNILLLNAYHNLLPVRTHSIPVEVLMPALGWEESQNIENLRKALATLASTPIEFDVMGDINQKWSVTSIISFGDITGGICTYRYDEFIAKKLHNPDIYARINIAIQRLFSSGKALALYENCIRYINVGSTGWMDLQTIRKLLDVNQEYYNDFRQLHSKIIKKAVEEINNCSDIEVSYDLKRENKKVSSIKFSLKRRKLNLTLENKEIDINEDVKNKDAFKKLIEHGFSEEKAISYVSENEERVNQIVALAEEKDKEGSIKSTTTAFIRALLDQKIDLAKNVYEIKKEKQKIEAVEEEKEIKEQEKIKEFLQIERNAAFKKISENEKIVLAQEFIQSNEGKMYAEKFKPNGIKFFSDTLANLAFTSWIRIEKIQVNFDEEKFSEWLKNK